MVSIKLVFIAILLVIVCAFAQAQESKEVAEFAQGDVAKEEASRWGWQEENNGEEVNENEEEVPEEEENQRESRDDSFPPCRPPPHSSSSSSSSSTSSTSTPTRAPTSTPTSTPTRTPTRAPTTAPTRTPTRAPTTTPTRAPTSAPTRTPTHAPTTTPTHAPTPAPTRTPTRAPTTTPTRTPTPAPTRTPTRAPTTTPTRAPTPAPTRTPTRAPTTTPTRAPSTSSSSSSSGSTVGLCDLVPTSSEPLKMLLPLYVYPGSSWDQVVTAASQIDIIAIINPNSGPTSTADSSYVTYMNRLNAAGVEQIGYVYTSYGDRAISAVEADIDTYASKFPHITGIFFDEASASASDVSYYSQLYDYVLSKGFVYSILNPGTLPAEGYLSISTSIVMYEDAGSGAASASTASWVTCASTSSEKQGYKYKFAGIGHSTAQSSISTYITSFQNKGMGLVFVTDGVAGCCTYNSMPSYFSTEVSVIAGLN